MAMRRTPPAPRPEPRLIEEPFQRVFDPEKTEDATEIKRIYGLVLRDQAFIMKEQIDYSQRTGKYKQLMRWVEFVSKTPDQIEDELDELDSLPLVEKPDLDAEDREALEGEDVD